MRPRPLKMLKRLDTGINNQTLKKICGFYIADGKKKWKWQKELLRTTIPLSRQGKFSCEPLPLGHWSARKKDMYKFQQQ